jgi:DNA polymerase-3 subunit alpha
MGNTDGFFQIESEGMKKMFKSLNKVDFEALIAGVSLYRRNAGGDSKIG